MWEGPGMFVTKKPVKNDEIFQIYTHGFIVKPLIFSLTKEYGRTGGN